MISQREIEKVVAAYGPSGGIVTFPFRADLALPGDPLWARSAYDQLPPQRRMIVGLLREQIAEGRYFVPTEMIVEKLLARLVVDRIAV